MSFQDELELEKEEEFERKFNFRYEEPDQEFVSSLFRVFNEWKIQFEMNKNISVQIF